MESFENVTWLLLWKHTVDARLQKRRVNRGNTAVIKSTVLQPRIFV